MAVNLQFCINKSGKTYTVHDSSNGNSVVGEIGNREAFINYGDEGNQRSIVFLDPNGKFRKTIINTTKYPLPSKFLTPCTSYPYGTVTLGGVTYKTYKMRQTETVYMGDATVWGSVAAGQYVASTNATVGSSHTNWKQINYVRRTDGEWIKVDGNGYKYGFVNTGIASASGYASIPFYGSW